MCVSQGAVDGSQSAGPEDGPTVADASIMRFTLPTRQHQRLL